MLSRMGFKMVYKILFMFAVAVGFYGCYLVASGLSGLLDSNISTTDVLSVYNFILIVTLYESLYGQ